MTCFLFNANDESVFDEKGRSVARKAGRRKGKDMKRPCPTFFVGTKGSSSCGRRLIRRMRTRKKEGGEKERKIERREREGEKDREGREGEKEGRDKERKEKERKRGKRRREGKKEGKEKERRKERGEREEEKERKRGK